MLNWMVMFIFSVLDWKYPFGANSVKKIKSSVEDQTWYLDWLECAMVMFIISLSESKFSFWTNLVKKNCVIKMKLWYLSQFKYAVFDFNVYLPSFGWEAFFGWCCCLFSMGDWMICWPKKLNSSFLPWYVAFAKWKRCKKSWFKVINIQETSNILFIHYNYEQYLKKFILLFPNIYQCKVDSIILPNSALCLPHKNKMIRFSFSTLNSK